jgi:hypothetical protein
LLSRSKELSSLHDGEKISDQVTARSGFNHIADENAFADRRTGSTRLIGLQNQNGLQDEDGPSFLSYLVNPVNPVFFNF